jgi:hypothetical protein
VKRKIISPGPPLPGREEYARCLKYVQVYQPLDHYLVDNRHNLEILNYICSRDINHNKTFYEYAMIGKKLSNFEIFGTLTEIEYGKIFYNILTEKYQADYHDTTANFNEGIDYMKEKLIMFVP